MAYIAWQMYHIETHDQSFEEIREREGFSYIELVYYLYIAYDKLKQELFRLTEENH